MSWPRRKPIQYLDDMLDCCDAIVEFTKGVTEDHFYATRLLRDAIIRNVEVLGEAARQWTEVMQDAPERFPGIPFRIMYLTRNRLIHGYDSVKPLIVWEVATREVPFLRTALIEARATWPAELV